MLQKIQALGGLFLQKYFYLFFFSLFLLSRVFVLSNPPAFYSDVTHYHEKYANAWYYGLTPYLEYSFEYGPAAAGLIYAPLLLDQNGIGEYYLDYRFIMFSFDALLFFVLLKSHRKLQSTSTVGIFLYLLITTLGKDWLYEGIDMAFVSVAMLCVFTYLSHSKLQRASSWLTYWLSTAIKFLTLPLVVPIYLLNRQKFTISILIAAVGFLVVWGGPLMVFRSSLSVPFVLNAERTIKYNTITDTIIRSINFYSRTEKRSDLPPDFSWVGPVSTSAKKVVDTVYPVSLLTVLAWSSVLIFKTEKPKGKVISTDVVKQFFKANELSSQTKHSLLLTIYFVYFLTSFLTAKIYSNPFLLWVLPMLIIYRWTTPLKRNIYFICTLVWGVMELTPFLSAQNLGLATMTWFNGEAYDITLGWLRWALVIAILVLVVADARKKKFSKLLY